MDIFEFRVKTIGGTETTLAPYRGKVLLIVNTASKCGFTPQLGELEELYRKYKEKGLVVLGFPCNQFHEQDPEDNRVIEQFCQKNYGVTFPMFAKVKVNGPDACPLFAYLTSQKGFAGFDENHPIAAKLDEILRQEQGDYQNDSSIKWNFTKFLISRDGDVVSRFEPTSLPADIAPAVEKLL